MILLVLLVLIVLLQKWRYGVCKSFSVLLRFYMALKALAEESSSRLSWLCCNSKFNLSSTCIFVRIELLAVNIMIFHSSLDLTLTDHGSYLLKLLYIIKLLLYRVWLMPSIY